MTEEEKQRIRDEEIFREEVRKTLQESKGKGGRLWKFLNSSLGIFLLSSICVSGLTFAFSQWRDRRNERNRISEQIRRLDIEIGYRASKIIALEKTEFIFTEMYNARAAFHGEPQRLEDVGRVDNFNPIFPEYRGRTLASILLELKGLVAPDEAPAIEEAFQATKRIPDYIYIETHAMKRVKAVAEDEDSIWQFNEGVRERYISEVTAYFKNPRWAY